MFRHLYKSFYKPKNRRLLPNALDGKLPIHDLSLKVHLQAFAVDLSKQDLMATDGSDFVSQWNGSSATNVNVTQSIQTQKPQYIDNLINGFPALSFDGVNDFLRNNTTVPDFSLVTMFVVGRFLVNDKSALVELSNGTINTGASLFHTTNAGNLTIFRIQDSVGLKDVATSGSFLDHIYTGIADGVNSRFRIDFTPEGTTAAGTIDNTLSVLDIGQLASGIFRLNGNVGEVIIYDRALSASEITQTEIYLGCKWNIFFSP